MLLYDNVGASIYSTVTLPHLAGEAVRGDLGAALQTAYLRHGAYHSDHLRAAGQQSAVTWVRHEQMIHFVKKYTDTSITNSHTSINTNTTNTATSTYTNNANTSTNSITARIKKKTGTQTSAPT